MCPDTSHRINTHVRKIPEPWTFRKKRSQFYFKVLTQKFKTGYPYLQRVLRCSDTVVDALWQEQERGYSVYKGTQTWGCSHHESGGQKRVIGSKYEQSTFRCVENDETSNCVEFICAYYGNVK